VVLSSSWQVEQVNPAFSELLGCKADQIIGLQAGELFREVNSVGKDSPWNTSELISPDGFGSRVVFRVQELPPDGWVLFIVPERETILMSEAFKEPNASTDQVLLLGHLAGGIAHDLNNILTGVLGHLSLAKDSISDRESSLISAADGAKRACLIAGQVLDFVRGSDSKRRTLDLAEVADKVVSLLRVSLSKNIILHVDLENAPVIANEGELSQLIMNLALNARDAMLEGGELSITLNVKGRFACLSIADTGSGISAELKERIFDPFFTTKREGTGLGLANVKRIVRELDGEIAFSSEPGRGTIFEILLPISDEVLEEASESQEPRSVSEKILVVEDEETVRIVMQRSLEHLGYTVDVAENGVEALKRFEQSPEAYQLVIVDVMMPQMAGDELFFKLRELNPTIPVLVASGYASDSRTRKMLDAGLCGYIQKPFGVDDLAAEVSRCIESYARAK